MPHLLIAGATGTGKSVTINTIITSLVYRHTPRELRLLMVDPKMVELSMYNALPHLRHKVVTNNHDAAAVLKWAVFEMNRRYELLQANGARNLADFNRKVEEGKPLRNPPRPKISLVTISAEAPDTPPEPPSEETYTEGVLPMIVIVIDELADLMMTVQAEVETPLAMLAQKARAIGIHLILATQRPSVNVITGLIKANFPSRIAFRVASKVDSRTILDQNGAEALLGNGDMLFLPPGKSEPMRLQGAYIGTEDSERVMEWYVGRREARRAAVQTAAAEADILEMVRPQEGEGRGRPGRRRGRASATRSSGTRPRRASRTRAGRPRCCSAGCGSATGARRGSSISCTMPGSSVRRTAASRARCWSGSISWTSTASEANAVRDPAGRLEMLNMTGASRFSLSSFSRHPSPRPGRRRLPPGRRAARRHADGSAISRRSPTRSAGGRPAPAPTSGPSTGRWSASGRRASKRGRSRSRCRGSGSSGPPARR